MNGTIDNLHARFTKALTFAKANGWGIAQRLAIDPEARTCCAIGAVAIEAQEPLDMDEPAPCDFVDVAGRHFNFSDKETESFIAGFDDQLLAGREDELDFALVDLGARLRREWL